MIMQQYYGGSLKVQVVECRGGSSDARTRARLRAWTRSKPYFCAPRRQRRFKFRVGSDSGRAAMACSPGSPAIIMWHQVTVGPEPRRAPRPFALAAPSQRTVTDDRVGVRLGSL